MRSRSHTGESERDHLYADTKAKHRCARLVFVFVRVRVCPAVRQYVLLSLLLLLLQAGRLLYTRSFFLKCSRSKKRAEHTVDSRPGWVRSSCQLVVGSDSTTPCYFRKKKQNHQIRMSPKKQMSEAWCVRVQQARRQITTARDENDHFYF